MDDTIPRSILLIVLIILSGFFAASETAYSYCNKLRIRKRTEDGDKRAARALRVIDDFNNMLTTILIGNNLCHIFASSIAAIIFVRIMGTGGAVLSTVLLTVVIFLFGETIPKSFARANSDACALAVSLPVRALMTILTPANLLFSGLGKVFIMLFPKCDDSPSCTEDEFSNIVDSIQEEGLIEPEESRLIKSAIEFSDISVNEIMTPIDKAVSVDISVRQDDLKALILNKKYSRIPVYAGAPERIIGVLRVRDCLFRFANNLPVNTAALMNMPYKISPEAKLDTVFEELGRRRTHIAIVSADDGTALGIVTMEDIIEELVGEIYDEDDIILTSKEVVRQK